MKRTVNTNQHEFLKREFKFLEENGHLEPQQAEKLLSLYQLKTYPEKTEPASKPSINFVQTLLLFGALLIGLGILSFVATNWEALSKLSKFIILFITLFSFYTGGVFFEKKRPQTAKALFYIGAFAFGAEIFYIGQMFHLGGKHENAFLAWGVGLLPLAYYLKDRILKIVSIAFIYYAIEVKFMFGEGWMPYMMIVIIPLLFILGKKVANDLKEIFFMNLVLVYQFVEMQFMFADGWKALWVLAFLPLFFIIEKKVKEYKELVFIANLLLIYQFIEMHIAWNAVDHVQISYVLAGIVVTAGLFWYGHVKLQRFLPLFLANLALSIQWIYLLLYTSGVNNVSYYVATTFVLGVIIQMLQRNFPEYPDVLKIIGIIFHFSMALVLTSPFIWLGFEQSPKLSGLQQGEFTTYPIECMIPSVLFGVLYALYGFFLVKKEQLLGIAVVGVMVLRYYTDYSFKFFDKSIAFMIGGILLIALGYWFERTRRKEAKKNGKPLENK